MNMIMKDGRVSLGWVLVAGFLGIAATASLMTPTQSVDAMINDLTSPEPVESVLTQRGYRTATIAPSQPGAAAAAGAVEPSDAVDVPSSVMQRRGTRPPMVLSYVPSDAVAQIARPGRRR
jgi:hypothetical protein